ncbi:hypothetical protein [Flagellimonas baculiformis]|uniref:hypothetical protein n=1 Tax=Flagellimonas baculiformis TaxID=3067310 RepID=UPI00296EC989|nr:hypothetical protein [Muricauda sp. D6]
MQKFQYMVIVLLISIGVSRANAEGIVTSMEQIAWSQMEQTDNVRGRIEKPEVEGGGNVVPWLPNTIQCRNLLKMCIEFFNITN